MARKYSHKKEFDCCGKTKYENKKLKTANRQLKKALDQMIQKVSYYDEVLEITKVKKKEEKQRDKEDWSCHQCGRGYLKIVRLYQKNGVFYIRICNNDNCQHKTKKKMWNKNVRGIES